MVECLHLLFAIIVLALLHNNHERVRGAFLLLHPNRCLNENA